MSSFLTAKYDSALNQIYDPTVVRGVPVMAESNAVTGVVIKTIWNGTQAQYDAIVTKDASTLYVIVG